jgi:predicted GNAT family acetyltransferase
VPPRLLTRCRLLQRARPLTGSRRFNSATEVSGVRTHPEHRRKRYAPLLIGAITKTILERGDTAFLHMKNDNGVAASEYEQLGVEVRTVLILEE